MNGEEIKKAIGNNKHNIGPYGLILMLFILMMFKGKLMNGNDNKHYSDTLLSKIEKIDQKVDKLSHEMVEVRTVLKIMNKKESQ